MDRELLIEIGVEELPASWMPGLTRQLAERLDARLAEFRIAPGAPIESFSTPRRLTVRVAHIAERQDDLDETITGPPVSAAFGKDGQPSRGGAGICQEAGRGVRAADARADAEGRVPRLSEAPARAQRRRYAARHPHRLPSRSRIPQADALGRDARRRARGAAVRPPHPLAALSLRRPRRPVHDRAIGRQRPDLRSRTWSPAR